MDQLILPLLLATLSLLPPSLLAQSSTNPVSEISVEGSVFCDPCFANVFSKYSFSGADVQVQCKLKANPPGTAETIAFSVNRTTNRNGVFKLELPHLDGIDCVEGPPILFSCQAMLLRSSSSGCNVPGPRTTAYQLSIKSKQSNQCVYSFPGLSFRPAQRNDTLCGRKEEDSKVHIPGRGTTRARHPSRHPFTRPPPFRFPLPQRPLKPPPFRFPLPQRPFNPPTPSFSSSPPPPPAFSIDHPITWFPTNPFQSPSPPTPPPPMFNPMDPRSWSKLEPTQPAGTLKHKKP